MNSILTLLQEEFQKESQEARSWMAVGKWLWNDHTPSCEPRVENKFNLLQFLLFLETILIEFIILNLQCCCYHGMTLFKWSGIRSDCMLNWSTRKVWIGHCSLINCVHQILLNTYFLNNILDLRTSAHKNLSLLELHNQYTFVHGIHYQTLHYGEQRLKMWYNY